MSEEIYTEESSDQEEWTVTKLSKRKARNVKIESHKVSTTTTSHSKIKHPQKFCEKWMDIFQPWLSRCKDDPHKPFCLACQCRLDCNKCHLQRHERTSKHARNLDIFKSGGEGAALENLNVRQERSKYYYRKKNKQNAAAHNDIETCEIYLEESCPDDDTVKYDQNESLGSGGLSNEDNYTDIIGLKQELSSENSRSPLHNTRNIKTEKVVVRRLDPLVSSSSTSTSATKKDRMKLFMQIQKDKTELLESFKELIESNNIVAPIKYTPPREKNSVDLFFESVSSTVKTWSPKLIAEAKMRISQLVCDLELQAITENDSSSNGDRLTTSTEVKPAVVDHEAISNHFTTNDM